MVDISDLCTNYLLRRAEDRRGNQPKKEKCLQTESLREEPSKPYCIRQETTVFVDCPAGFNSCIDTVSSLWSYSCLLE